MLFSSEKMVVYTYNIKRLYSFQINWRFKAGQPLMISGAELRGFQGPMGPSEIHRGILEPS